MKVYLDKTQHSPDLKGLQIALFNQLLSFFRFFVCLFVCLFLIYYSYSLIYFCFLQGIHCIVRMALAEEKFLEVARR